MNEEVFAKGLEKCRLLTRLLRQNVENLDDYGCPKIQHLIGEGKTTVRGSAVVTPSDTKQGFTVPRGKQSCIENGLGNIYLRKFRKCSLDFVFTTNLILSTRHDFFYSIHCEKLRLRNR